MIFGTGPCHWFGSSKRVRCEKGAQVMNFMSQVSSSATCQSFLELIGKCSVSWRWSFSQDFHWNCINSHSLKMKWENSRNLRWLGNCSEGFSGLSRGYFVHLLKVPGFPDASGMARSLHCPSLFYKENVYLDPGRTSCFLCTSGRLF